MAGKGLMLRRRWNHVVFLELRRDSRVTTGISGFLLGWPWDPKLPFKFRGKAGGCARVTAGPKRPHLGVCPGPNSPLMGRNPPAGDSGLIPGSGRSPGEGNGNPPEEVYSAGDVNPLSPELGTSLGKKNHVVPSSSQHEPLARYSISKEVPRSH